MKITAIKQQVKRQGRYSIFVEGKYSFSLGETALLEQKLTLGQELDEFRIRELKKLSEDDKIYNAALNYLAIRMRSKWEIETYLKRKDASPALIETILNKLSDINVLDDVKFAEAYIRDRRLLRPTSKRKLILELRKKRIATDVIQQAMADEDNSQDTELASLAEVISRKRRQTRYQDNTKLMQYLAGQGFNYGDIKAVLEELEQQDQD